ncbi:MAG: cofactor-independent phosphoglycerate mutase [Planctomycetales bacterium]|nr:cofactor-independent phosphoglycerate mutase [Planctomycetales bacterium]
MKYVIIVPDGAADNPQSCFGGKTVIEAAATPNMDKIAMDGRQGICRTVPTGMTPGSDVAMMSVLGYDPAKNYTGRAPIEAVAQDIPLGPQDWVFRCNLVTTADEKMVDHSAGHISTKEAGALIGELAKAIALDTVSLHTGVSYRHLCVIKGHDFSKVVTCPPHDFIGEKLSKILPKGKNSEFLNTLIAKSVQLFENHPINKVRRDLGENPVTTIWLWGQGQKAGMERFEKKYGKKGAAITAVDLVRGLAKLIGFDLISVPGATGYVDTNYAGKGEAAIEALDKYDVVLVHIEAPDEASHSGNLHHKKQAIEAIDKFIVGPVYEAIQTFKHYRILVMPDHPTPVEERCHIGGPVPFAMAGHGIKRVLNAKPFCERNSFESGFEIRNGPDMMEYFIQP